jgi:hypothetical protein
MYELTQHQKGHGLRLEDTKANYILLNINGKVIQSYTKDVSIETIWNDAEDYLKRIDK